MKNISMYITGFILTVCSASSQAFTVWAVESGQDPFSNSQSSLTLAAGTTTLDVYYDVGADTSYGYDFILDIFGTGSISNVGGGDSGLGDIFGSGWRQFGGSIFGESGSSVLAFTLDFTADGSTSLLVSGTYTNAGFLDTPISASTLASVTSVPVPAAAWLFGSGLLAFGAFTKQRKA